MMNRDKITYVQRNLSAERHYDLPMEKGRAKLDEHMAGAMYDAEREISRAFKLLSGALGFTCGGLHKTGKDHSESEYSDEELELIERLAELKKNMPSRHYGITLDLAVFCFDIDDVCYQRNMGRGAVIKTFTEGLNEWCRLRGWGCQLT